MTRIVGEGAGVRGSRVGSRWACTFLVAGMSSLGVGCGTTIPYGSVLAQLPPEDLVRIEEQWVRIEQVGDGEPVMFVHGFGASTFSWREVLPDVGARYRAVAVDLNGFGYTERPTEEKAYTLVGQVEHVLRVADALGLRSFHLVGHSYGAGVALLLASRHADRVRSLTLVDGGMATGGSGGPSIPRLLRPLAQLLVRGLLLTERNIRSALEGAVYDPSVVSDAMVGGYLRPLRVEGFGEAFRGLLSSADNPPADFDLETITVPTMVIWGEDDPVFPESAGRNLAAQIDGARFVALERTGHLPMEEQPEAFNEQLLGFLDDMAER